VRVNNPWLSAGQLAAVGPRFNCFPPSLVGQGPRPRREQRVARLDRCGDGARSPGGAGRTPVGVQIGTDHLSRPVAIGSVVDVNTEASHARRDARESHLLPAHCAPTNSCRARYESGSAPRDVMLRWFCRIAVE